MSAAVRSLRDSAKYNGKIRFYVVTVDSKQVRQEVEAWKVLGNHGLVGTSPDRKLLVHIPGHEFGKNQILEKAEALLRANSPPG